MVTRRERATALVLKREGRSPSGSFLTLEEVACGCDLHPDVVWRFYTLGLIDPLEMMEEGDYLFGQEVLHRVRKILRLRRDLGLNLPGVGVVLELLDRIDFLEARVRDLEALLEAR